MDGILLFNKPILWTSHDAVDFVRRRIGQKSVGHAGTLDPLATGLLILLIGRYTKKMNEFAALDKEYLAQMLLGTETDTFDLEGRIVAEKNIDSIDVPEIGRVLTQLSGSQQQIPPRYAALKRGGMKLCDLARQGISVQVESRPVQINTLELLSYEAPLAQLRIECSKGTYIRTLCQDIGARLGCGAVMSGLVRTRIGPFHLKDAANEDQSDYENLLRR